MGSLSPTLAPHYRITPLHPPALRTTVLRSLRCQRVINLALLTRSTLPYSAAAPTSLRTTVLHSEGDVVRDRKQYQEGGSASACGIHRGILKRSKEGFAFLSLLEFRKYIATSIYAYRQRCRWRKEARRWHLYGVTVIPLLS